MCRTVTFSRPRSDFTPARLAARRIFDDSRSVSRRLCVVVIVRRNVCVRFFRPSLRAVAFDIRNVAVSVHRDAHFTFGRIAPLLPRAGTLSDGRGPGVGPG